MKNTNTGPIQVNELTKETKVSLRTRVISAIVAIVICAPCFVFGDFLCAILFAFLLTVSVIEIIKCSKQKYSIFLYIFCLLIAVLLSYWPMVANITDWENWSIYQGFYTISLSILVLCAAAFLFFYIVIIDKSFTVRDACYIFTTIFLVSFGFQSVMFLRYFPCYINMYENGVTSRFNLWNNLESCLLVLYVLFGSLLNDVGAYFFGIFFGHKKINPRISEKKTWAGFFGGIFSSAIFTMALAFILAAVNHPIGGILTIDRWYHIVILSLVMPIFATLGDFVFSSIKRFNGVKDFGKIMPGHGGVLDRIDSVVFTGIVVAIYVATFFNSTGAPILV